MKLYHGTTAEFTQFAPSKMELGIHVAVSPLVALGRLEESAKRTEILPEGSRIVEIEAELNALKVTQDIHNWGRLENVLPMLPKRYQHVKDIDALREALITDGYNAIEYPNEYEPTGTNVGNLFGKTSKSRVSYAVLKPEILQITKTWNQTILERKLKRVWIDEVT